MGAHIPAVIIFIQIGVVVCHTPLSDGEMLHVGVRVAVAEQNVGQGSGAVGSLWTQSEENGIVYLKFMRRIYIEKDQNHCLIFIIFHKKKTS